MRSSAFVLLIIVCTMLGAQTYVPALPGYQYKFPRDDFSHPEYQTEWWYYTGNLRAKDGHRFGFELTFFRQGVPHGQGSSPWLVTDLYMAHLALSDISGGHYYQMERINRAGPGIAGVSAMLQVVWNGNWKTKIEPERHSLQAISDDFSFSLQAKPLKSPVIQGTDGISQKAQGVGQASHYISYTRMDSKGSIRLHGKDYEVEGDTWMDHEFFTESPGSDEVGWDWVSLELSNGCDLMLYRLRHADGSVDPYSSGTYVDAEGRSSHLSLADIQMNAAGSTWRSGQTGAVYPLNWEVSIPRLSLELRLTTPLENQEFLSRIGPSYWEGSIEAVGRLGGAPVQGSGYLELTGYANHGSPVLPQSAR